MAPAVAEPGKPASRFIVDRRLILGGVGAFVVLLIGLVAWHEMASPPTQAATDRPQSDRRGAVQRRELPVAPDPSTYSLRQLDDAVRQLGEARRLADAGDFVGAERMLKAAEATAPGLLEIAETRHGIEALNTPEGRLEALLVEARAATNRDDAEAALKALAAAEAIGRQTSEIARLRQAIANRQAQTVQRRERVTKLIAEMRSAVARRDFAAAYRAINEAERLDLVDPAVNAARAELARAQEDAQAR